MRLPRRATGVTTVLTALVAASLLGAAGPVYAGPRDEKVKVDANIEELSELLVGTSKELTDAYAALAASQAALPGAQAALDAAEAAEAEAERKDVELAGRLEAAQQSKADAEAEVAASTQEIVDSEAAIGRLAAEVYRSGHTSTQMQVALGSTTPDDFATKYVLADAVMRSRGGTLARLNETKALRSNAEARLAAVEVQVADLRQQAADNLVAAEAARQEAAQAKAAVDALIVQQTQATATIEARKAEETAKLAELKAEQDRLAAELKRIAAAEKAAAEKAAREAAAREAAARKRGAGSSSGGGGSSSGGGSSQSTLARPVGGPVTSGYGYRIHPIYKTKRLHAGIDFGSACGTPVRAAEDGRIVSAGNAGGYGNRIVVSHGVLRGEGVATSYNHLSGYKVTSGSVSRGQIIGYVGTTGSSTGCHLHFEVYVNGDHVNPSGWL